MNIAIIGTAGRKDDAPKLNAASFNKMVEAVQTIIRENFPSENITLVSGGAAWADHIAVYLALKNPAYGLELHMPAKWNATQQKYIETNQQFDSGGVANYYHRNFTAKTGINSLNQIHQAINNPKYTTKSNPAGFKARNTDVANSAQAMIALTFGNQATLKPGGTLDTWQKHTPKNTKGMWHIDLHTFKTFQTKMPKNPPVKNIEKLK